MKKTILGTGILAVLIAIACNNEGSAGQASGSAPDGQKIYKQNCAICHGNDGRLGSAGAKDLSVSTFTLEERIHIVKYGKGGMTPFNGVLNDAETEAVCVYLDELISGK